MALRQMLVPVLAIAMVGLGVSLSGCERQRVEAREVMFSLEPTRSNLLVGENTTIFAYSENLLGRDAEIEWDASGGELFTEDRGRIARVYFDEPGQYVVQANLILDGRLARSASTTVNVDPIPR